MDKEKGTLNQNSQSEVEQAPVSSIEEEKISHKHCPALPFQEGALAKDQKTPNQNSKAVDKISQPSFMSVNSKNEVTVYTAYSFGNKDSQDIKLQTFKVLKQEISRELTFMNQSNHISKLYPEISFYKLKMTRQISEEEFFQLVLSYSKIKLIWQKEGYEKTGRLFNEDQTLFIFAANFKNDSARNQCSSIPGYPIHDPLLEASIFLTELFQSENLNNLILSTSSLIKMFHAFFSPKEEQPTIPPKGLEAFFQMLEYAFHQVKSEIDKIVKLRHILFGIIGLLKIQKFSQYDKKIATSSIIKKLIGSPGVLIESLISTEEKCISEIKESIARGIIIKLLSDFDLQEQSSLQKFFNEVTEPGREQYFEMFLTNVPNLRGTLKDSQVQILTILIKNSFNGEIAKKFDHSLLNLRLSSNSLFQIINRVLDSEIEDNKTCADELISQKLRDNLDICQTLNEILEFIKEVYQINPEKQERFIKTDIQEQIWLRIKRHRNLDNAEVEILKKIMFSFENSKLLERLDKMKIIEQVFQCQKQTESKNFFLFLVSTEEENLLYSTFLELIKTQFKNLEYANKKLFFIKECLLAIKNEKILKQCSEATISETLESLKSSNDYLNVAHAIVQTGLECQLSEPFISKIFELQINNKLTESEFGVAQYLLNLFKNYKASSDNVIFQKVIDKVILKLNFKVTFQMIKDLFITQNQNESTLFTIISNLDIFASFQQFESLSTLKRIAQEIIHFSQLITSRNLTFEEINSLQQSCQKTKENLTTMISLAHSFLRLEFSLNDFNAGLENLKETAHQLTLDQNLLWEYLNHQNMNHQDPIYQELYQVKTNYLKMTVSTYALPPQALQFKENAEKFQILRGSQIFTNLLERKKKNEQVSSQQVNSCFLSTYKQLEAELKGLTNLKSYPISRLAFYEDTNNIENDIKCFEKIIPQALQYEALTQALQEFVFRDAFIDFCSSLIQMQMLLSAEWTGQIKICKDYLQIVETGFNKCGLFVFLAQSNVVKEKLLFNLPLQQRQIIFNVLHQFAASQDLLKFLIGLGAEQLEHLKDGVNDQDDGYVNTQTILNLITVWQYKNEVFISNLYDEVIGRINSNQTNKKYANITKLISSCAYQLKPLQELYLEINCREEAKKKQILKIMEWSTITLTKSKQENFDIIISYQREQGLKKIELNAENVQELRDRALLIEHTNSNSVSDPTDQSYFDQNKAELEYNQIKEYIVFSECILTLIDTLNQLQKTGFPGLSLIKNFDCQNCQYEPLKVAKRELVLVLEDWEKALIECYKENYLLTFLNGKHFWLLEKYFSNTPGDHQVALNFLQLMNKKPLAANMIRPEFNFECIKDRINQIGADLNLLQSKPPTLFQPELQIQNKITSNRGNSLYHETQNFLKGIISIFVNCSSNFPRTDQLFFCHENTQWLEVARFIYRACSSPNKEFHSFIQIENLTIETQLNLRELLISMKNDGIKPKLIFVTGDPNSQIASFIRNQYEAKHVRFDQLISDEVLRSIIEKADPTSLLVKSVRAGLGKSTLIRQKVKQSCLRDVYLLLAGELDLVSLGRRLQSIKDLKTPICLVIQISFIENLAVLNEFLICICLFKQFYYSENVFILPSNSRIFIELDNISGSKIFDSVPYLQLIKSHLIKKFDLSPFNSEYLPQSNLVCNYLEAFKNGDINKKEIQEVKLSQDLIKQILSEFFLSKQLQKQEEVSYLQLRAFVLILHSLISNFVMSPFGVFLINDYVKDAKSKGLSSLEREYRNLRAEIFKSFLDTLDEFITKGVKIVKQDQLSATIQNVNQGEEEKVGGQEVRFNITWKDSNHLIVIVLNDGTVLPVYKNKEQVPIGLQKLIFIQKKATELDGQKLAAILAKKEFAKELDDYEKFTHKDFLFSLQLFNSTVNINLVKLYGDNSDYVITSDNFLKMMLIYMRAMAHVPIIIMGETGCGKTSLVKFFVQNVLRNEFEVFNIHAGITSSHIDSKVKQYTALCNGDAKKKVWVFFDEFNTTKYIGIICEIICNRTYLGVRLPDNLIFVAACNPYKVKSQKMKFDENVGIRHSRQTTSNMRNLLYTVFPLPEKMIEYVWDFGVLTESDFISYIKAMVQTKKSAYHELVVNCINSAHQFFKELEDSSSVSLRDVYRFKILKDWFFEQIKIKSQLSQTPTSKKRYERNLKDFSLKLEDQNHQSDPELKSIILALCHCYYLRLSSSELRDQFLIKIYINVQNDNFKPASLKRIVETEQNDLIARMQIPSGTAINQALRENIFALVPCIINKIPIFICGKPGCSKSLAITLIITNLRGDKSQDEYFTHLPELAIISFQGSDSCTSEGILKAYERAKNYLKSDAKNLIPVFVFDEIGLAEISKHNPLKVLHALLETDQRSIAFIGVSNWRLDASKMNRALYLTRPDPGVEDLILTGLCIYRAMGKDNSQQQLIQNLAKAYHELKFYYKETKNADFYGLRDFYHLIKALSKVLQSGRDFTQREVLMQAKRCIQRNFGGKLNGAAKFGEFFTKNHHCEQEYPYLEDVDVLSLINDNLKDPESRYLMLISKGNIATYIMDKYLQIPINERRVLVGSNFSEDLNKEEYNFRSLSDVILYLEKGISVIFKNMDSIYSSLYDLFNQNFAHCADKKFCRIALGALSNPKCSVHEKFHCIVLMEDDDQQFLNADPPFLNRFEKHYLTLVNLLSEQHKYVVKQLVEWVNMLFQSLYVQGNEEIDVPINSVFPLYNEQILSLYVLMKSSNSDDLEIIFEKCQEELIKLASSDLLILTKLSKLPIQEKQKIQILFERSHCSSLRNLLDEQIRADGKNKKIIVYTFDNNQPQQFGVALVQKSESFRTEQELNKSLKEFYTSKKLFYILELDYQYESQHLPSLKFMVDKWEKETKERWTCNKLVCVIVTLKRNVIYGQSASMIYEGWEQILLDSLTENDKNITSETVEKSTKQIIQEERYFKFEDQLTQLTERSLLNLKFEEQEDGDNQKINQHIFFVIQNITRDAKMVQAIKQKILSDLEKGLRDWKKQVFMDKSVFMTSVNTHEAIKNVIKVEFEKKLTVILFMLEKYGAFDSYFHGDEEELGEANKEIWLEVFGNQNIENLRLQATLQSNIIRLTSGLVFPFSMLECQKLKELAIKQKEFEMVDEELFKLQDPLANFILFFKKTSTLREKLELLLTSKSLQQNYINDNLFVHFTENLINQDEVKFFKIILQPLFETENSFTSQLKEYLSIQELFVSISQIITVYKELLKNDVIPFLRKAFELRERLEWIEYMSQFIEAIIKKCLPTSQILQNCGSLQVYNKYLDTLYNILFFLKCRIPIMNLSVIKFFFDLSSFLISEKQVNEQYAIILSVSEKLASADYTILFQQEQFIDFVISKVNGQSENSNLFIQQYLTEILKELPSYLPKVVQHLDQLNFEQLSSCSALISTIMRASKIMSSLEEINLSEEEPIIQIENNEFIEGFEVFFQQKSIESQFGLLLNDQIVSKYEQSYEDVEIVQKLGPQIQFLLSNTEGSQVSQLVHFALLKSLMNGYITVLVDFKDRDRDGDRDRKLNEEQQNLLKSIDTSLIQNSIKLCNTLRLYGMKKLIDVQDYGMQELNNFVGKQLNEYDWCKQFYEEDSNGFEFEAPELEQVVDQGDLLIVRGIVKGDKISQQDFLARVKLGKASTTVRLSVGMALINKMFLLYLKYGLLKDEVKQFMNHEDTKKVLTDNWGKEYCSFVMSLTNNFSEGSELRLTQNMEANRAHSILTQCIIHLIVLSFKDQVNPISSGFFKNGQFSAEQVSKSIFFGMEDNFKLDQFHEMLQNFDQIKSTTYSKSYSKGGTYKCSNTCDFVYIIANCGGAVLTSNCPWCDQQIGGSNHKQVQREGHENLTDEEAKVYLQKRVLMYQSLIVPGYSQINTPLSQASHTVRGLSPITFRLLHLILHSTLNMLGVTGIAVQNDQNMIIPLAKLGNLHLSFQTFLQNHIDSDLSAINELLKNQDKHIYIWVYKILSDLILFLRNQTQELRNYDTRKQFEESFERQVVNPNLQNVVTTIQNEKRRIAALAQDQSALVQTIEQLQEISFNEQEHPFVRLFRITKSPTLKIMKSHFELKSLDKKYNLVKIFLANNQELLKLKILPQVVDFTNLMLNKFDYKISRDKARQTQVKEICDQDKAVGDLFKTFKDSWNKHMQNPIQYHCKELQQCEFEDDSSLLNFLVDNKEVGGGMYMAAALMNLANLQNKYLELVMNAYKIDKKITSSNLFNTTRYPIQRAQSSHIINFELDDDKVRSCALNNPAYGKGKDILFDYPRLQRNIGCDIPDKKYFDTENLNYISFQFELLTLLGQRASLITEVRGAIKQVPFSLQQEKSLKDFFSGQTNKSNKDLILRDFLSSLEYLICLLRNLTSGQNLESTVHSFCNKISCFPFNENFKKMTPISSVKLTSIIYLYEMVEEMCFPLVFDSLRDEYSVQEQQKTVRDQLERVFKQCAEENNRNFLPSVEEIKKAMMRFIIRCLSSDLTITDPLTFYLLREDFWPENIPEKLDNLKKVLPATFLIKHSKMIYSVMREITTPKQIQKPKVQANKPTVKNGKVQVNSKIREMRD